jgi:diaminobutyrate-2-oxoglutarate transaminase
MNIFSKYHLSESPKIVSPSIPGERSKALLKRQGEIEGSVVSYPRSMPIAIKRAKGAIIEDIDGNLFIDFFAGAGVLNLGHCNEDVLEYVYAQQKELIHALDFPTENKILAIEKILDNLPAHLKDQYKVSFGGPTGADAVEAAIKLAKMKTGRDTIIAFSGSYHGMSSGTVGLTSDVKYRSRINSSTPNIHFAPFPYCYRCPLGKAEQNCNVDCFDYLRNLINDSHSGIPLPAAIIIEPVQGEGGNIPANKVYLEKLVTLARRHGIIVIFDEIQAGFFRCGTFLSFMDTEAVPDIITMSKGLGGVGFPISAIIYKKDIEAWGPGDHIGTFRGNQVSLAAANGAFDFAARYEIGAHAAEMGEYLIAQLRRLLGDSPFVGEIRGKGLMIGIEWVRDRATKQPFPELVSALRQGCLQKGLLFEVGGHYENVIRLMPPLIITPKIIDNGVGILSGVLNEIAATALVL